MDKQGVRVLYVDDDPGIFRLAQKALERHGYAVERAVSPDEALARLDEDGADVIALDHNMPGGTGLDFLAELAKRVDPPPVVYVTGSGDTRVAVAALKAGAVDYVAKETGSEFLELLVSAIDSAVAQARLRREKAAAELAVREARDRAEMLLREVNHRVGNSLALVAAHGAHAKRDAVGCRLRRGADGDAGAHQCDRRRPPAALHLRRRALR